MNFNIAGKIAVLIILVFAIISCEDDPVKADDPSDQTTVTDIDGNEYETILIGDQEWMAENLKVTHYRDGTAISNETDNGAWAALTTEAFCIYNNTSNAVDTYGLLYNWWAATDGRNLAPEGWHVPTDAEWQVLIDYLGGNTDAGGKLKEAGTTHWVSPNTGANNESGFTGLPCGYRGFTDGSYGYMGYVAYFWSTAESDIFGAWGYRLGYSDQDISLYYNNKGLGYAIRCLKD